MGGACEFRFPPYPIIPAEGGVLNKEERIAEDIRMAVYKMGRKKLEKMKQMAEETKKTEKEKKVADQEMEREKLGKMNQKAQETKKIAKDKKVVNQDTESEKSEKTEVKVEMEDSETMETANQKPARKKSAGYSSPPPPFAVLWPVNKPLSMVHMTN